MRKNIKPFVIGAIFGGLLMPASYLIVGTCSLLIPNTYNDAGGYWNTTFCYFINISLYPLFAPALLLSKFLEESLRGYWPNENFFISTIPLLLGCIILALLYGLIFFGIHKTFVFIKNQFVKIKK